MIAHASPWKNEYFYVFKTLHFNKSFSIERIGNNNYSNCTKLDCRMVKIRDQKNSPIHLKNKNKKKKNILTYIFTHRLYIHRKGLHLVYENYARFRRNEHPARASSLPMLVIFPPAMLSAVPFLSLFFPDRFFRARGVFIVRRDRYRFSCASGNSVISGLLGRRSFSFEGAPPARRMLRQARPGRYIAWRSGKKRKSVC